MSTMAFQYFFVSTTLVDKPFTWKHGLGHELVGTHAKNLINKLKNAGLIPGLDSHI